MFATVCRTVPKRFGDPRSAAVPTRLSLSGRQKQIARKDMIGIMKRVLAILLATVAVAFGLGGGSAGLQNAPQQAAPQAAPPQQAPQAAPSQQPIQVFIQQPQAAQTTAPAQS